MKIKTLIITIFIFSLTNVFSQGTKNNLYTTTSEYNKQIKKFPAIKIVEPQKDTLVEEKIDIIYNNLSKRLLHLDAYQFKSTSKLPAVILLHGGGWKSGDKSMLKPLAHAIAKEGYNCFSIQYRLSEEAQYPASINDVLEAIGFIKENASTFNVDTLKVAILGCSSGGQMASLIGTKYVNSVQAIVNLDGVLAFHHPESEEGKLAAEWLGGTYEEKPEIWEDASAYNHVTKNTPPILFINSQYNRFHAGRDDMIAQLNEYKIYNRVEEIKESPHTFWLFEPWFKDTLSHITRFLNQQFKSN
jgi:acetyl esterase/lipase